MDDVSHIVRHRWNLPEDRDPPQPGDTIRGALPAHSWRVVEVIPIDSPIHSNAWRICCERLGPWDPAKHEGGRGFTWFYPTGRERAEIRQLEEQARA